MQSCHWICQTVCYLSVSIAHSFYSRCIARLPAQDRLPISKKHVLIRRETPARCAVCYSLPIKKESSTWFFCLACQRNVHRKCFQKLHLPVQHHSKPVEPLFSNPTCSIPSICPAAFANHSSPFSPGFSLPESKPNLPPPSQHCCG